MSAVIQLEFNLENKTNEEIQLSILQKQVDQMNDSMGKVRRKLFSELGEVKKICSELQQENYDLKNLIKELKNEKTSWLYKTEGRLFVEEKY
ncbi:MAG: hypothetical protein ABFD00_10500 [Chloroherpetonaceae bacterium]